MANALRSSTDDVTGGSLNRIAPAGFIGFCLRLPFTLVLWFAFSHSGYAQINLDRLFPPVVSVGAETAITAEGKFPKWPPGVDCDSGSVSVSVGEESGQLTVKVADDASPGVAWIRLFDEQSATALVPLVLSVADVISETEPNDKRSQANQLSVPAVIVGRLSKGGDSDAYSVAIKAGQTLVVSATANEVLKSPMDAVLQLADLRGNVLAQSDDVRGLDPQIVFTSDCDQDVLVRIFAFPETPNSTVGFAGSAAFVYSLDVTTGPFVDHVASDGKTIVPFGYNLDPQDSAAVVPPESEKTVALSPPVAMMHGALGWSWLPPVEGTVNRVLPGDPFDGQLPAVLFGHFTKPDETHRYAFATSKGTKYRAEVRSKVDGFLVDSKLTIIDQESETTLASNDDANRGRYDAGVDFSAADDGVVEVVISEMLGGFGPRHFYQLSVHPSEPRCLLSVSEDHFVVTQEKPLEITVLVNRISGFDEKVQVVATDLPEGIACEPVISESKGDTSKSIKLKLVAGESARGHGKFRVVGAVVDADDRSTANTIGASFELRPSVPVTEFRLTVPPASSVETKP